MAIAPTETMPIAVNVMGGDETDNRMVDFGGQEIAVPGLGYSKAALEGAMQAADMGIPVTLVGNAEALPKGHGLDVVDAPDHIAMEDHNFAARVSGDRRTGSISIVRAVRGHKDGEFSAVVCAGSTGGAMAAASMILGRVTGIDRPAIPTLMPYVGADGSVTGKVLLDSGANPFTNARQFVDNALLGAVYAEARLDTVEPRVGILTNGTEEGKGSEVDQQVYAFLSAYGEQLGLNFIGNVEGSDVFGGTRVDVVLANGLTGNIVLKTAEGLGVMIKSVLFGSLTGASEEELAAFNLIAPRMITPLTEAISKNKVGGAPLLGVNGDVIIAHGSSSAEGVKNAIIQANLLAGKGLMLAIAEKVAAVRQNQAVLDAYTALGKKTTVTS